MPTRRKPSGYIAASLQPDETLIRIGSVHPAYLLGPAFATIAVGFGILKFIAITRLDASTGWVWIMFLVPVAYFFQHVLIMSTSEAALTSRRVLTKTGILRREISEILLSKVESAAIRQSLPGRLFDFGDLVVKGSGGTSVSAPALAGIMDFRAAVQNSIP